jgi:rare lipoprotein A
MKTRIILCNLLIMLAHTLIAQDTTIVMWDTAAVAIDTTVSIEEGKSEANQKILTGTASYYAAKFEGRKTANGEIFRHSKLTAACNVLPLGTWIEVTNIKNGKKVIVKTNDRLHPKMTRIVDLTRAAATKLDFINAGLAKVKVRVLGKKYKP